MQLMFHCENVSGINNQAAIGTRANNFDELKKSEWLTGLAWLKQPQVKSSWSRLQVKRTYPSQSSWHRLKKKCCHSVGTIQ